MCVRVILTIDAEIQEAMRLFLELFGVMDMVPRGRE